MLPMVLICFCQGSACTLIAVTVEEGAILEAKASIIAEIFKYWFSTMAPNSRKTPASIMSMRFVMEGLRSFISFMSSLPDLLVRIQRHHPSRHPENGAG